MEQNEVSIKYSDYRRIPPFIEAVANWYIDNLTEEDKEYIKPNHCIEEYRDTLCLHIRNEFLYPQKSLISQEIEKYAQNNKDTSALFIDSIFADDIFNNADYYSKQVFEAIIKKLSIQ